MTLGEAGRRGRTGYGFTRDSLEDLGLQPQRRPRGRGGPSLKQGRSRPVPQILELEEDGEEYDGEYDDYDDEYAYSDEEEEEELGWPHEVRPARTSKLCQKIYMYRVGRDRTNEPKNSKSPQSKKKCIPAECSVVTNGLPAKE